MYCVPHREREKARIAIRALNKITSYVDGLSWEEVEGVPGLATGTAIMALEDLNQYDES